MKMRSIQSRTERAFTLIEVMIASGILFLCLFAILGVLATGLRNARALKRTTAAEAGTVVSYFAGLTNRVQEGIECGSFRDLGEFSERYRDFEWCKDTQQFDTNGMWIEYYTVRRKSTGQIESSLDRLVFDPQTKSKSAGPG